MAPLPYFPDVGNDFSPSRSHAMAYFELNLFQIGYGHLYLISDSVHVLLCVTFLKSICIFHTYIDCERFEPRSHFKSRLSLIVRVNVVLNRTVVVDSD